MESCPVLSKAKFNRAAIPYGGPKMSAITRKNIDGIWTSASGEKILAAGRDAFLKRVWSWKEESGGLIINQLKRLGASCDWSRERFTMGKNGAPDDQMVRAVTKVFVELYNKKLIYKDKRLVNWDPHFESAISDLEVVQVEKKGSFKFTRRCASVTGMLGSTRTATPARAGSRRRSPTADTPAANQLRAALAR